MGPVYTIPFRRRTVFDANSKRNIIVKRVAVKRPSATYYIVLLSSSGRRRPTKTKKTKKPARSSGSAVTCFDSVSSVALGKTLRAYTISYTLTRRRAFIFRSFLTRAHTNIVRVFLFFVTRSCARAFRDSVADGRKLRRRRTCDRITVPPPSTVVYY